MLINGFPIERLPGMSRMAREEITDRLNTALVGEDNEAGIHVKPFLKRSGTHLDVGTVDLRAEVRCEDRSVPRAKITETQVDSAYGEWTRRAREKWRGYLEWEKQWLEQHPDRSGTITAREGGALDSMRAWAKRHPLTVSTTFDNEAGPDFSAIFEEAVVIEDTTRLKDYAIRLRDFLRRREAEEIYREIQPSISDETGTHQVTYSPAKDSALAHIRTEWCEDFHTSFSRSDVRVRKWSGGRVWELFVVREGERKPLFHSTGGRYQKIYVAEIEGKLRVVRLRA